MATGISIKVKTEELVSTAGDVEQKIQNLEQMFQRVEQTVQASRSYWDGEGRSAYWSAYQKKMQIIQTALRRFRENVTDLREIAGVYEAGEREAAAINTALRVDEIV